VSIAYGVRASPRREASSYVPAYAWRLDDVVSGISIDDRTPSVSLVVHSNMSPSLVGGTSKPSSVSNSSSWSSSVS
jgi:hypothetical protein